MTPAWSRRRTTFRDARRKVMHSVTYDSNYSRVDGLTLIEK